MISSGMPLAIVVVTTDGGSPSKVVDEGELRAPKDGGGMRQGLDEADVGGQRLWPLGRWAKGSLGPMGKSIDYIYSIQRSAHPATEQSGKRVSNGLARRRKGRLLERKKGKAGAGGPKQSWNSPVLPVQVLGVEVEDGQSSVGKPFEVRVLHG